jgi:hypothetical protein
MPRSFSPTKQGSKPVASCLFVPCHCSLSVSFPHAAAQFSVYSSGRRAMEQLSSMVGQPTARPSFQAVSSFPNGARAPNSTFFNLVVVAPGWRVGVVHVVWPCRARIRCQARAPIGSCKHATLVVPIIVMLLRGRGSYLRHVVVSTVPLWFSYCSPFLAKRSPHPGTSRVDDVRGDIPQGLAP